MPSTRLRSWVLEAEQQQRAQQRTNTEHSGSPGSSVTRDDLRFEPLSYPGRINEAKAPHHLVVGEHRVTALHDDAARSRARAARSAALDEGAPAT